MQVVSPESDCGVMFTNSIAWVFKIIITNGNFWMSQINFLTKDQLCGSIIESFSSIGDVRIFSHNYTKVCCYEILTCVYK